MKTRTHIIAATLTLLIAASVAAWSQQKQAGKSEHGQPTARVGEAHAAPANSTTRPNKATAGSVDSIE